MAGDIKPLSDRLRRLRDSLLLTILVALAIRLIVIAFLFPDLLNPRDDHFSFGYEMGRIGRALTLGLGFVEPVNHGTNPTAWVTPLYPLLVAGVFKLFGIYTAASAFVLLSLNAVFSSLNCIPIFFIARHSFGPRVATWSAWAWALFPYSIYLGAVWVWDTCLTTLLLSLLFLNALHLARSTRTAAWTGFGLLWGATALVNPAVLSVLPVLAGWACYRLHRAGQPWAKSAAIAALIFVVTVMPWFLRNYRTFHEWIPFRDNFWLEAYVGNHGDTSHSVVDAAHPNSDPHELELFNRLGELGYMSLKRTQTIAFVSEHPAWFVGVTLRRIFDTWTGFWGWPAPGQIALNFDPELPCDPTSVLLCTLLSILAFLGLRRAYQLNPSATTAFALVLLTFPIVYYVTHRDPRYRHPIDPEILILAVLAAVSLLSPERKSKEPKLQS